MPWQRGGVLLSHVDREETHALSAIINVAQVQGACTLPFCPPARAQNVFCTSPTERRVVSLRGTTFNLHPHELSVDSATIQPGPVR